MSEVNAFKALSLCTTICVGMSAVAACTVHLRGDENQPQPTASGARESDPVAVELERCRTIDYEQKDRLADCRKLWGGQRRQFLGRGSESPNHSVRSDPGASTPAPSKDQSRLPSIPAPMESER
jgi:conjugative transfer region protein TrbK